jgi:hypothetical protein
MSHHFIQNIEYIKNPKYKDSYDPIFSEADNEYVFRMTTDIDELLQSSHIQGTKPQVVQGLIKNKMLALQQFVSDKSKGNMELQEALTLAVEVATTYLVEYIEFTYNPGFKAKKSLVASSQLDSLKENGYLELSFGNNPDFEAWRAQLLEQARAKYHGLEDWRGANSMSFHEQGYQIIEQFVRQNQILELISAYKGMDMELEYAAWDYAHFRQKWFRVSDDINSMNPTNYYHYDADVNVAKMLVYLTDVSLKDGPFRFVKGSNTEKRSVCVTALNHGLERGTNKKLKVYNKLYPRTLWNERKDLLMKFPIAFMGATHFGDDLHAQNPLTKYLLDKTEIFVRPAGSAILFDGFAGVHAGGNAAEGERLAVQIAFKRKDNGIKQLKKDLNRFKMKAKYSLKSLIKA